MSEILGKDWEILIFVLLEVYSFPLKCRKFSKDFSEEIFFPFSLSEFSLKNWKEFSD